MASTFHSILEQDSITVVVSKLATDANRRLLETKTNDQLRKFVTRRLQDASIRTVSGNPLDLEDVTDTIYNTLQPESTQ
eukprot:5609083-Amphidinium_carterae.1